jgi:sulfate permease, SulP family
MRPLVDQAKPAVVLLDCRSVLDIEYTALKMLTAAEARLRGEGTELWLAGCNPEVLKVVRNSKLDQERMFFNVAEAVKHYESRVRADEAQGLRQGAGAAAR